MILNDEPEVGKTLLTKEQLSDMLTTEFISREYIPERFYLEVTELSLGDDGVLKVDLNIFKENLH